MRTNLVLHFVVCFVMTLFITLAFRFTGASVAHSELAGVSCALCLGVGKEYGDSKCRYNRFDVVDLLADALGSLTAVLATVFFI